jgi:hypothetical protein
LVYVRGRWCSPSSGIWSCDVELSGRFPLEDTYPKLQKFFVDKLGVVVADSGVLVEELRQEALRAPADQTRLKDIMRVLSQLLAKDSDAAAHETQFRELRKVRFLPVRKGQACSLEKLNGAYFVVDHERYGTAFSGKLALLDFPYSDMSILLPLLKALKIPPERYLSQGVSSETVVGSSVKNTKLTKHLRSRAYALSWYVSIQLAIRSS